VLIKRRSEGWCYLCHRPVRPEDEAFDHIIALEKGGSHTFANIGFTHRACNGRKSTGTVQELWLMQVELVRAFNQRPEVKEIQRRFRCDATLTQAELDAVYAPLVAQLWLDQDGLHRAGLLAYG
jgi:hypothetical protein